jgi:hypothetical protein
MAVETLMEDVQQRKRLRKLVITILIAVVALHIGVGIVAGILVVARYFLPPPATFEIQKDIRLPAKEREHKMNMSEFDAMTPKPSFNDRLQSMRPTDFSLPELPKVPMDQMLPLDPSAIVSDQISSMVGTAGLGDGGDGGSGMGGMGNGVSFMGVQSEGSKILLIFDVSTSVVNKATKAGVPLSKIKEETSALIGKLPISSRFGVIQFTRNYKPFKDELLPATDQNRAEGVAWVESEWVESGMMQASGTVRSNPSGIIGVLALAAKMQPDLVFMISDGSFQWRPPEGEKSSKEEVSSYGEDVPFERLDKALADFQKSLPEHATIHFIGFGMDPEDQRGMRRVISRHGNGGKVREIR